MLRIYPGSGVVWIPPWSRLCPHACAHTWAMVVLRLGHPNRRLGHPHRSGCRSSGKMLWAPSVGGEDHAYMVPHTQLQPVLPLLKATTACTESASAGSPGARAGRAARTRGAARRPDSNFSERSTSLGGPPAVLARVHAVRSHNRRAAHSTPQLDHGQCTWRPRQGGDPGGKGVQALARI